MSIKLTNKRKIVNKILGQKRFILLVTMAIEIDTMVVVKYYVNELKTSSMYTTSVHFLTRG